MGATYTRQSTITDGAVIEASHFNDEFDQLLAAFAVSTGHSHDGTAAEGGPITKLLGTSLTLGDGTSGTDITVTFDGETNDGVLTWMEDEDLFKFTDTINVGVDDAGHDVKFFGDTASRYWLWDTSADGVVQRGTLTVGVDDTGHDVKLFGATSGSYLLWDESADSLLLTDSTPLKIGDNQDLTLYHDGSNSYITNAVGALKIATETSGIAVTIGHTTSEVTVADNLTVTGTLTLGSGAELTEAELEFLDGITAGTAAASKAMVADSNIDITGGRNITISGELDAATLDISGNADIDGTTNLDAVDIDGAVQLDSTFTVGADDTGYDVKFFGDTASAYMLWDTSADDLVLAGAAGIDLAGDIDVDGTANLDNTDIDGTLAVDGTTISLDATTSLNIDNSNTSNGITIGTATSGVPISIGHTTSETTINDNATVTGNLSVGGNFDVTGSFDMSDADITNIGSIALDTITNDGTDITLDSSGDIILDAAGDTIFLKDAGTTFGSLDNTSGNLIIKSGTTTALTFSGANVTLAGDLTISGDDITMGTNTDTAIMVADGTNFNPVVPSGDVGLTNAGVFSIASGVIVNADVNASAAIADSKLATISTADKVSGAAIQIDGATDGTSITLADADKILVDDGGTTKYITASQLNTYTSTSISADDIGTGDAAVTLTTSSGNITIDAAANNTDIIFKGTDATSDITMLTLDGSEAGAATFNNKIVATELDISGNVDVDGTLEADAYTVDGTTLAEYIADTSGAMFTSNTETGITATYQDGDNTVDLAIDAAQTVITSIYATDLILGEDSQTAIDFGTANEIDFKADNAARLTLTSSALYPVTDNEIDLGTSSLEFKDAYFDGTVTSDAFAGPLTGDVTGNVSGTAATVTTAAQSNITSLGTLTTLTVDNVIINGSTIGHTGDTDLITVASGIATVAGEVSMTTLDIGGTNVTTTAAELNLIDGGTSRGTDALADGDGILINDGGTMKMTNVTTVKTYMQGTAASKGFAIALAVAL